MLLYLLAIDPWSCDESFLQALQPELIGLYKDNHRLPSSKREHPAPVWLHLKEWMSNTEVFD